MGNVEKKIGYYGLLIILFNCWFFGLLITYELITNKRFSTSENFSGNYDFWYFFQFIIWFYIVYISHKKLFRVMKFDINCFFILILSMSLWIIVQF